MRARDVMSRPVLTATPDTSLDEVGETLAERGFAALPVVDEGGQLVGIVGEADLLRHRIPLDPTAHQRRDVSGMVDRSRRVADVMHRPVYTVSPAADVADVADLLLERQLRSVPVVADGKLVGIVSRRDLLHTVVRNDDALRADVRHRLDEYGGGHRHWTVTVTDGVVDITGAVADEAERQVLAVLAGTVPGVTDVRVMSDSAVG